MSFASSKAAAGTECWILCGPKEWPKEEKRDRADARGRWKLWLGSRSIFQTQPCWHTGILDFVKVTSHTDPWIPSSNSCARWHFHLLLGLMSLFLVHEAWRQKTLHLQPSVHQRGIMWKKKVSPYLLGLLYHQQKFVFQQTALLIQDILKGYNSIRMKVLRWYVMVSMSCKMQSKELNFPKGFSSWRKN